MTPSEAHDAAYRRDPGHDESIQSRKPWTSFPYGLQARNVVRCEGDPLGQIVWQGRQWAVTSDGLEARNGQYVIEKNRLWEDWDLRACGGWEEHMVDKGWVDFFEFRVAIAIARDYHRKLNPWIKRGTFK